MLVGPELVAPAAVALLASTAVSIFSGGGGTSVRDCLCKCPEVDLQPVVKAIDRQGLSHEAQCPDPDLKPIVDSLQNLGGFPTFISWLISLSVLGALLLGVAVGFCCGAGGAPFWKGRQEKGRPAPPPQLRNPVANLRWLLEAPELQ